MEKNEVLGVAERQLMLYSLVDVAPLGLWMFYPCGRDGHDGREFGECTCRAGKGSGGVQRPGNVTEKEPGIGRSGKGQGHRKALILYDFHVQYMSR